MHPTPIYMSPRDICARYHCSRSHLYRVLGDGLIRAKKNGLRLLIEVASADAYFASLPDAVIKPDRRRLQNPGG